MAMNWKTFGTRAGTAGIFVLVMLLGLLWNGWSFFLLCSVIHAGCWLEYQRLVQQIDPGYQEITRFHQFGVISAGWSLMLFASGKLLALGDIHLDSLGFWLGIILLFCLPILEILFARRVNTRNIAHSVFGLLYISLPMALLMDLRSGRPWMPGPEASGPIRLLGESLGEFSGYAIPLVIIATLWINDTMAYIVGSFIGRTPLTAISPKKTWEGTVGGILLAVVTVTLIGTYLLHGTAWNFALLSLVVSISGTFGDLLESKLKRLAGVKDSGRILPGHGGFLDRFDSLLLAVPFAWICCILFLR